MQIFNNILEVSGIPGYSQLHRLQTKGFELPRGQGMLFKWVFHEEILRDKFNLLRPKKKKSSERSTKALVNQNFSKKI